MRVPVVICVTVLYSLDICFHDCKMLFKFEVDYSKNKQQKISHTKQKYQKTVTKTKQDVYTEKGL